MIIENIEINGKTAVGLKFPLGKAPLIVIKAHKGYIMCGYLNMQVANKLEDVCARVTGVNDIEDILSSPVVEVSKEAEKLGINTGMDGKQALELMF